MSEGSAFLSGAMIGLVITIPVGPMSVLCIQRALVSGPLAGFATGLGAATVLAAYSACAILGLCSTASWSLETNEALLSAVSACLLMWFGIRIISRTVSLGVPITDGRSPLSFYCSAVACALVNPLTPVLLAAVIPSVALPEPTTASLMVAGVFVTSVTWWLIVSGCAAALRSRLNVTALNLINKASGLVLGTLGILMALRAYDLQP